MERYQGLVIVIAVIAVCGLGILGLMVLDSLPAFLVDQGVAVRALETQGYSEVEITERQWFAVEYRGCSDDDVVKFTATAVNPAGDPVEVYVCAGWPFKGATVRTSSIRELDHLAYN